jgi:hypothetical protein
MALLIWPQTIQGMFVQSTYTFLYFLLFRPGTSDDGKAAFQAGHPKMVKLEEVVVEHFNKFHAG